MLIVCGGVFAFLMFRTPKSFIELKEVIKNKSYDYIVACYGAGEEYVLSSNEAEELCSIIQGSFEEEWIREEKLYGGVTCWIQFKTANCEHLLSINLWEDRMEISYDFGKHLVNRSSGPQMYAYLKTLISELP